MAKTLPTPRVLQRFGSLRVVIPEGRRSGRRAALCLCDCGQLKAAVMQQLYSGATASCGSPVHRRQDLDGQRFGCRVVLESVVPGRPGYALCSCDCGAVSAVFKPDLLRSAPKHCKQCAPCINKQTPDRRALRKVWQRILDRTTNPKSGDWHHYGGRGIEVCPEWRNSFEQFRLDMGPRPKGYKVERYDNDGPYAPWNCGWEPQSVQVRNQRTNVFVTYQGKRMVLTDAAQAAGLKAGVVFSRRHRGWPEEHWLKPVGFTYRR